MSIRIDQEKCIGCAGCAGICPGTLISLREKTAHMDYPRDCWGCASCVKECPVSAIDFFLGADIGGGGGIVHVMLGGDVRPWSLRKMG